jgi:hypothetical protein
MEACITQEECTTAEVCIEQEECTTAADTTGVVITEVVVVTE